jgi:hypothetical protein
MFFGFIWYIELSLGILNVTKNLLILQSHRNLVVIKGSVTILYSRYSHYKLLYASIDFSLIIAYTYGIVYPHSRLFPFTFNHSTLS